MLITVNDIETSIANIVDSGKRELLSLL